MVDFKDIENTNDDYTHDETNVIILKDPSKPFVLVVPNDDGDFDDVFLIDSKTGDSSHKGALNVKSLFIGGKEIIDESGQISFSTLKKFTVKGDSYIEKSSISGNRLIDASVQGDKLVNNSIPNDKHIDSSIEKTKFKSPFVGYRFENVSGELRFGDRSLTVSYGAEVSITPFISTVYFTINPRIGDIVWDAEQSPIDFAEFTADLSDLPYFPVDFDLTIAHGVIYSSQNLSNSKDTEIISVSLYFGIDRDKSEITVGIAGSSHIKAVNSIDLIEVQGTFVMGRGVAALNRNEAFNRRGLRSIDG